MKDAADRATDALAKLESSGLDLAAVRSLVRGRLATRGASEDDVNDLCQEALSRLIAAARHGTEDDDSPIRSLTAYSLTVADRVFDDFIRRTRPNWCRLRRRIVYLLDLQRPGNPFARWRLRVDWIGGLAVWRGREFRANRLTQQWRDDPRGFWRQSGEAEEAASLPLHQVLHTLFRRIATPLEIAELTTHVAVLQGIEDPATLSLEDQPGLEGRIAAQARDVAEQIIDEIGTDQLRQRLWQLLCEVPINQRVALLLGLSRSELVLIARVTEVATALGVGIAEMNTLWSELPLTDRAIATRLNLTPKQVSNLRKCARERLARGLAKFPDA